MQNNQYTINSVTMGIIKTCLVVILGSVIVLATGVLLFPNWLATGMNIIVPILMVGLIIIAITYKVRERLE